MGAAGGFLPPEGRPGPLAPGLRPRQPGRLPRKARTTRAISGARLWGQPGSCVPFISPFPGGTLPSGLWGLALGSPGRQSALEFVFFRSYWSGAINRQLSFLPRPLPWPGPTQQLAAPKAGQLPGSPRAASPFLTGTVILIWRPQSGLG